MNCKHEKLTPVGENEEWCLMNWNSEGNEYLKINMCKKCHLLYWENKK